MFDRADLRAAVEADIISADQASRLEAFMNRRGDPKASVAAGENLRFLANFNDVFITIGLVILTFGLTAVFAQMIIGDFDPDIDGISRAPALVLMPVAGLMWVLAEYFCRRRRLLLPSMALSLIIALYTALSAAALFGGEEVRSGFRGLPSLASIGYAFAGGWLAASVAFFVRFRLPFTFLLMALGVAAFAYTAAASSGSIGMVFGGVLSLMLGLGTLAAGIFFDAKDPERATRASDNAFWLHLAAAPQIIMGLRGLVSGYALNSSAVSENAEAIVLLAALIGFGALSLALNRRALIVSGLITFAVALGVLVSNVGGDPLTSFMLTAVILGGGVVLLGGGWRTARRALLTVLPRQGVAARIFPPEPA
ncbi:MAG: hypothetical protein AAFX03_10655 [Pseudomonadota bacterium]